MYFSLYNALVLFIGPMYNKLLKSKHVKSNGLCSMLTASLLYYSIQLKCTLYIVQVHCSAFLNPKPFKQSQVLRMLKYFC